MSANEASTLAPPAETTGRGLMAEVRVRLLWLTVFRTVLAAILLSLLAFQVRARVEVLEPSEYASFGLLGLVFVMTLVTGLLLRAGWVPRVALWVHVVFDVALSGSVVMLTARGDSPFTFLFLLAIIGAAIVLGRGGAAFATVASFAALVLIAQPWRHDHFRGFDLLVQGVAQVLVAVLSAYVTEQLSRSNTRLVESREDLSRLTALHREIVTAMPSGLLTVDEHGRATYVNPAAQAILGADLPEGFVEQLVSSLPRGGGSLRRAERVVSTARGERILGLSRAPLAQEGTALIVFQDLTELRRLEGELKRIDHLASLGRVSAQLAHEVRNPLAAMRGAAQMLGGNISPQDEKLVRLIVREADRLASLVDGYLQLAKPPPPTKQRVTLDRLVRETLEMLKADPSLPHIETELAPCEVEVDGSQMKQVMINLLRNSVTATRGAGRIKVSTALVNDAAVLTVWDSAGSIPAEDTERIFEPFFSRSVGGTGLGLSTVRTIVHAHGAKIAVKSNPTDGTTFTLTFAKAR